jgi:uncharacterized protein (TIGR02246 family)
MRTALISVGLLVGLAVLLSPAVKSQLDSKKESVSVAVQGEQKAGKQATGDRNADEAAIRANVAAFAKAYNAKDSKAIAALFTRDGQIVGKEGDISEGRAAIERAFKDIFAESAEKHIEVTVESIRFIGPDLAMEVGTTKETFAPGEPPDYDRYTVLHVKRDGKWLMAMARDEEGPAPTPHEQLRPLAWLIGEWVDDDGRVEVKSTCRWSEDGNFLLQEFNIQVSGKSESRVSQRIGWDPVAKRIRSWVFDSEGGFGESLWTRDEDVWVIKATGVRPDGTTASSTNMLVPAGKDAYVWRSRDRVMGDEIVPNVEVKVVRKPPQPKR